MRPESARRPRGRPRDARVDEAILEAALDLFIEAGFEGMSIEDVAERAGVARATVYRRWPSKQELVFAAIESCFEMLVPDSGEVQADLIAGVRQARHFLTETKAGEALPRMVPEFAAGTPFGVAYLERVIRPRFQLVMEALARGQQRGELRDDLDLELALAAIVGPMMFLRLTRRMREMGPDLPERIVRQAIEGLGPRTPSKPESGNG
ncbi:MAG TPA: TetR/AcrR family transcriptional regulator [Actinomycetota bacterium]